VRRGVLLKKKICLLLLGILAASYTCAGQTSAPADTQQTALAVSPIDPKAHDAAVKLVVAIGLREKMKSNLDKMLADGIDTMKKKFPQINPAFYDEWTKRMRERINFDDYAAIAVSVYEKHFTAAELDEMTQQQIAANQLNTPTYSEPLKEKLQAVMSQIVSEMMGGFTQLGAKLGAEVGGDIGKEHPDWVPDSVTKDATAPK
jgi:hypothetical protein